MEIENFPIGTVVRVRRGHRHGYGETVGVVHWYHGTRALTGIRLHGIITHNMIWWGKPTARFADLSFWPDELEAIEGNRDAQACIEAREYMTFMRTTHGMNSQRAKDAEAQCIRLEAMPDRAPTNHLSGPCWTQD